MQLSRFFGLQLYTLAFGVVVAGVKFADYREDIGFIEGFDVGRRYGAHEERERERCRVELGRQ